MLSDRTADPGLLEIERECLKRASWGYSVKEIAEQLGITPKSAEKRMSAARKKLGAKTREQAVAIAIYRRTLL